MNLMPPEFVRPPPTTEEAEPMPPPVARPRYARTPSRNTDHNPFAHPMNFSLAPREQQRTAGGGLGRGMDLSAGPVVRGGRLMESVSHTISPGGMGDYMALIQDFVEEHKYYPEGAIRNEEQGGATVEVTVLRDGRVKALTLVDSSGSHLLDAAWMSVFRDNRLPPLSDDIPGNEFTFRFRLNYELIYAGRGGGFGRGY
jgi:protein TonB